MKNYENTMKIPANTPYRLPFFKPADPCFIPFFCRMPGQHLQDERLQRPGRHAEPAAAAGEAAATGALEAWRWPQAGLRLWRRAGAAATTGPGEAAAGPAPTAAI